MKLLEDWMRSYRPEELFDAKGTLVPELKALAPKGHRRMSANPHANGGVLRKELRAARLPQLRRHRLDARDGVAHENTRPLGEYLRDVMRQQSHQLQGLWSGRDRVEQAAGTV